MKRLYKDCIIIDVRDAYEFNQGHIDNALNIPYSQLTGRLPFNRFSKLAVYSSSGYHSKLARKLLESMGFEVEDLGDYDSLHLPKMEVNRVNMDRMGRAHIAY